MTTPEHLVKDVADIASFARQLAQQFRQERRTATVWDINNGLCEEFAYALEAAFPGGEVVDLEEVAFEEDHLAPYDYPGHFAYRYRGRYYDAQNPDGVDHWRDLDIIRCGNVVTRGEYLRGKGLAETVVDRLLENDCSARARRLLTAAGFQDLAEGRQSPLDRVKEAVDWLYDEDPEFVDGGCYDTTLFVKKVCQRLRIRCQIVTGHVIDDFGNDIQHAWVVVAGEPFDPVAYAVGWEGTNYRPDANIPQASDLGMDVTDMVARYFRQR